MGPKAQVTKDKINKLNFSKLQNPHTSKDMIKKIEDKPQSVRNACKSYI